jgi:hypothetical protein
MDRRNQLSPKEAIAWGLLMVAIGVFAALSTAGLVLPSAKQAADAPPWIGFCVGAVFAFGGLALIVGYAVAGGATPDGDLPSGTPQWIRLTQMMLGLGIVGSMGAIASWIAFGPGPRQFSSNIPLLAGEKFGRTAFGVGAVLIWVFFVVLAGSSLRRLFRQRRAD